MRTNIYRSLLGAVFLITVTAVCSAMISFRYTSPKQAEELGIEVNCQAAGPENVWVLISFAPKGELKAFEKTQQGVYIDLRIERDKKQVLSAPLREDRSKDGRVSVKFLIERSQLKNASVWLIDYVTHGGTAEVLKLQEHVDLEELAELEKLQAQERAKAREADRNKHGAPGDAPGSKKPEKSAR